jgi:hypothetical protein
VIAEAPSAKAQEQAITLATIRGRVSFFGGLPMTAPCACNVLLLNVTYRFVETGRTRSAANGAFDHSGPVSITMSSNRAGWFGR